MYRYRGYFQNLVSIYLFFPASATKTHTHNTSHLPTNNPTNPYFLPYTPKHTPHHTITFQHTSHHFPSFYNIFKDVSNPYLTTIKFLTTHCIKSTDSQKMDTICLYRDYYIYFLCPFFYYIKLYKNQTRRVCLA